LGGQLVATLTSTTTTYHHADHLSVWVSTDSNGNKIGEQGHLPYGEQWYAASATTKFIFTTYERDGESGNDYAMARFYINRFGRFCSVDLVDGKSADPQSWNHYVYVRDNPVNLTDPSGKFWQFFFALLGQLIGRLVMGFVQSGIQDMLGIHINFGGIEIPGMPVDLRTPPTFPTGPGTDWQTVLSGRPDPSKAVIVDTWGASSFQDAGPGPGAGQRKDCPPEKRRFFDWLDKPLGGMASDLGTTKTLMLTLAAKEAGWTEKDLDHNQPLNNPFGVNKINKKGQAAGNINYPTLGNAIEDWKVQGTAAGGIPWGERVKGAETPADFVRALQHPTKGLPYNTQDPRWEKNFYAIEMPKWMERCGITP
jgi:RHS repeat-associated protein